MEEATVTAVANAVELNDVLDSHEAEQNMRGEQEYRADGEADSAADATEDRQDATEAAQEQRQTESGPQS